MAYRQIEIEKDQNNLKVLVEGESVPEIYPLSKIMSVNPTEMLGRGLISSHPYEDLLKVRLDLEGENRYFEFNLQQVTNQPTWTFDTNGLNQAVEDLSSWSSSSSGGGGGSYTPSTPSAIVATTDGATTAGWKSFSLQFLGEGGTYAGRDMPDLQIINEVNPAGLGSVPYTVPTTQGVDGKTEIIITYQA